MRVVHFKRVPNGSMVVCFEVRLTCVCFDTRLKVVCFEGILRISEKWNNPPRLPVGSEAVLVGLEAVSRVGGSWATLRAAVATTSTGSAFITVVAATAVHWLAADVSASRQVEQPAPPRLPHLILPQRRVASPIFLQDQGRAAAAKRAEHSWC